MGEGRGEKSITHCLPSKPQITAELHLFNSEVLESKIFFVQIFRIEIHSQDSLRTEEFVLPNLEAINRSHLAIVGI